MTAAGTPPGVRGVPPVAPSATRLVLVRHGEAVCNVEGVVGGRTGCRGLTDRGEAQVAALAARLRRTGELAGATALYSSVLPRARRTAELLAPALADRGGAPLAVVERCDLCELHPGEGDGLSWGEFTARFGEPRWDEDPTVPLAPGGESWAGFMVRAATAVEEVAAAHPGGLVVVACHAGVIEAALTAFLPVDLAGPWRPRLRTAHASLTEFEGAPGAWLLLRYNDATPLDGGAAPPGGADGGRGQQA